MAIPQQKPVAARPKPKRRKRRRVWKDKHFRWVPDGNGDWRVQGYVYRHHHKPKRGHFRGPGPKASRQTAATAPATAISDPRPPGAFQGAFGHAQAVRLLQRAGFGPVPGQAEQLTAMGLAAAVRSLTRPGGPAVLSGPPPGDDDGNPLAPGDAWGHDHLWWLDRMVRTNQPLVERMTLVFHDWFATSNANVSKTQQMIDQSNLFRSRCFGSFLDLFKAVTIEPGMPEPAGTGLSRRSFLSRSAGLALAVYGASRIPLSAFETGIAQAAQGDKILVSVFFDGGIDSLSVLAPVGDSR
jgi:Protein of unknown function (DUF1800)